MRRKLGRFFAILTLLICTVTPSVAAYMPQPPELVIIMRQAPEDVSVFLVTEEGVKSIARDRVAAETYFIFYYPDIGPVSEITLKITGGGTEYEQVLGPEFLHGRDGIVTLDFAARTAMAGKSLSRSIFLVGRRLIAVLAVKGLIFLLFGFHKQSSWLVFLVLNLSTQGWLHLALDGGLPLGNHLITPLILRGLVALTLELVGALLLIKEYHRRRVAYALVANCSSLVWGGYLITALPV